MSMSAQIPYGRYFLQFYPPNGSSPLFIYVDNEGFVFSGPTLPPLSSCIFQISLVSGQSNQVQVFESVATMGATVNSPIQPSAIQGEVGLKKFPVKYIQPDDFNTYEAEEVDDPNHLNFRLSHVPKDGSEETGFWTVLNDTEASSVALKAAISGNQAMQSFSFINVHEISSGNFFILTEDESSQLYSIPDSAEIRIGASADLPSGAKDVFLITQVGTEDRWLIGMHLASGEEVNSGLADVGNDVWNLELGEENAQQFWINEIEAEGEDDTPIYEVVASPVNEELLYLTDDPNSTGTANMQTKGTDKKQKWKFVRSNTLDVPGAGY